MPRNTDMMPAVTPARLLGKRSSSSRAHQRGAHVGADADLGKLVVLEPRILQRVCKAESSLF